MTKHLKAVFVTFLFTITTVMVFFPIFILAIFKLLIPLQSVRNQIHRALDWCASQWMSFNKWQQEWLLPTQIHAEGLQDLSPDQWYLMVANHQSWVDILVILRLFNKRISYIKFFLKHTLLYIPFMGFAFWALDFPYMRRYTKQELEKNPGLKGKDIERTRRSCEVFRHNPVTMVNFMEGTRFTPVKYQQQASVYKHLLMPKAGGVSFALAAMDGQLKRLLDLTIYYPEKVPSYWEYASGQVKDIRVHLRQCAISPELIGDYANDAVFRERFQQWVNQLWRDKDHQLESMSKEFRSN